MNASNPPAWWERVQLAAEDRVHGSTRIARTAANGFSRLDPRHTSSEDVLEALRMLFRGQPAMGPVHNLCTLLVEAYRESGLSGVTRAAAGYLEHASEAGAAFEWRFRDQPPRGSGEKIWYFFSYSAIVLRAAAMLPDALHPARAMVGRSLPGGEGETFAHELEEVGWRVTLVEDDDLLKSISEGKGNRLILGCDSLDDTWFVNKIGSGLLAARAHLRAIPVEIWTTSLKCLPQGGVELLNPVPPLEDGRADSIPQDKGLFGRGPLTHIARVRTELGNWNPREASAHCRSLPMHDIPLLTGEANQEE